MRLGIPATGEAYYHNKRHVEAICSASEEGQTILILGPRRAGKTSLMLTAEAVLQERNGQRRTFYADLSFAKSPWELLRQIDPDQRRDLVVGQIQAEKRKDLDDLMRSMAAVLERLLGSIDSLVLFLDEVERPIADSDSKAWVLVLNMLGANPSVSLVLSAEPFRLRIIRDRHENLHFLATAKTLRLTPWTADAVRAFIFANLSDTKDRDALADQIASKLAPAWPYEVIVTLFEIEDSPSDLDERKLDHILNIAASEIAGSVSLKSHTLSILNQREAHPAAFFLEALARADGDLTIDDAADLAKGKYAVSELARAAQRLEDLGLVTLHSRKRHARPATGLIARRLQLDYVAQGDGT